MTEAEELELLELEEEEARLGQGAQTPAPSAEDKARASVPAFAGMEPGFKRDAAEKGYSALAGLTQGATYGGAAKYQAAQDTALGTAASVLKNPRQLLEPGKLIDNVKGAYGAIRDAKSAQFKGAEALNPKIFGATEFAGGFIPTAGLPAGGLARFAAKGAVQGGANALGHSEADSIGGLALDTLGGAAAGAVLDKAGGAIARRLKGGGFAKWLAGKSQKAGAEIAEDVTERETQKVASQLGTARSSIQSGSRDLEVLEAAAARGDEGAKAFLATPKAQELRASVVAGKLESAPQRIEEILKAKQSYREMADALPENVAKGIREKTENPIRSELFNDRMKKHYINKFGVPVLSVGGAVLGNEMAGEDNSLLGSAIGGGLGIAAGAAAGRPGDVIMNRLRSPALRKFAADTGRSAMSGLGSAVDASVLPAVREFTDDPEKFRAFSEWLRAQNAP